MMLLVHLNSPEYQGWSAQGNVVKLPNRTDVSKHLTREVNSPVTLNSQEGMIFLVEFYAEVTVAFLQGKASVQ